MPMRSAVPSTPPIPAPDRRQVVVEASPCPRSRPPSSRCSRAPTGSGTTCPRSSATSSTRCRSSAPCSRPCRGSSPARAPSSSKFSTNWPASKCGAPIALVVHALAVEHLRPALRVEVGQAVEGEDVGDDAGHHLGDRRTARHLDDRLVGDDLVHRRCPGRIRLGRLDASPRRARSPRDDRLGVLGDVAQLLDERLAARDAVDRRRRRAAGCLRPRGCSCPCTSRSSPRAALPPGGPPRPSACRRSRARSSTAPRPWRAGATSG